MRYAHSIVILFGISQGHLLGIYTISVYILLFSCCCCLHDKNVMTKKTYTSEQKEAFQKDSWAMQNHAAKLMKSHRISFCLRSPISKNESIKVVSRSPIKKDGDKRFGFTGLQCCGCVHGCPMCSNRISLHRENEVRYVSDWAKSHGYMVAMLTLTHPHRKSDLLRCQLDCLLGYNENGKRVRGAMYHFRNSRAFRALNLVGDIKKFETTYGQKNGYHPHHHIMLIIDPKVCGTIDEHKLYLAWANACEKSGLERPSLRRGLQLDFAKNDDDISAYIAKMGTWDFAKEMTADQSKTSEKGKTQWQLLRDSKDGDRLAGSLFVEFVTETKGVKSLVFSRGLKDLVGLDNVSDEVLSDDVESVEEIVFSFVNMWLNFKGDMEVSSIRLEGKRLWDLVMHHGSRYDLLRAAKDGGHKGCYDYLIKLVIANDIYKLEDFPYMAPVEIRPDS